MALPQGCEIQNPSIELYLGDCLVELPKLPERSVDLIVTSPPYNLNIKYRSYQDGQKRDEYLNWCQQWARELRRVLQDDGSFFLNLGGSPSNPYLPHEIVLAFREIFVLQNEIHWVKAISVETAGGAMVSRGHFKPISSRRFVNDCHEYIFHFTKTGRVEINRKAVGVPYADKRNVARWGHTEGADQRCRGNNWFIPYQTIRDRKLERPHPASFPPALAENCILLHGRRDDLVMLDPFVGIGNSAVAAKRLKIGRFIGLDIDEEYLGVAAQKTGSRVTVCLTGQRGTNSTP